jgi:hypothetical protein
MFVFRFILSRNKSVYINLENVRQICKRVKSEYAIGRAFMVFDSEVHCGILIMFSITLHLPTLNVLIGSS